RSARRPALEPWLHARDTGARQPGGHLARPLSRDRALDQWRGRAGDRRARGRRDLAVRRVVSPVLRLVRGSLPDALTTARRGHAGARAPLGFPLCNAAPPCQPFPLVRVVFVSNTCRRTLGEPCTGLALTATSTPVTC